MSRRHRNRSTFRLLLATVLVPGTLSPALAAGGGRVNHQATLLEDGRVLILGGKDAVAEAAGEPASSSLPSSGLLFEPALGTWATLPALSRGRSGHTVTPLADGRVLLVGGYRDSEIFGAEIFDPASGTTVSAGEMAERRAGHTATLLADGRVLVAGGGRGDAPATRSEIFDPESSTWTTVPGLEHPRVLHRATLLADGRVLVTGGTDRHGVLSEAEVFDPASGSWSAAGSSILPRTFHTATLLPDGRVLIAGGLAFGVPTTASELFDPTSGDPSTYSWSLSEDRQLNQARAMHTATLLADGRVLVAGGAAGSGFLASAELFDSEREVWSAAGDLALERAFHTATLLADGRVLVAGGSAKAGTGLAPELFNPATGSWSLADSRCHSTAGAAPECSPTDEGCRTWMHRWPLPLLEEIQAARAPDGTPVCRGLYKINVVVEVKARRVEAGWEKGAIRVEGLVAQGREEAYRLAEVANQRKAGERTVDLPLSQRWSPLPLEAAQIWLSRRGLMRISGGEDLPVPIFDVVDVAEFATSVRHAEPEKPFELAADRAQPFARVAEILHALEHAGVESVGLRAQAPPHHRGEGQLLRSIGGLTLSLERIDPASVGATPKLVSIAVGAGGRLSVAGEILHAGESLAERLRAAGPPAPPLSVVLQPLPGATHGDLVAVLDALEEARRQGVELLPATVSLPRAAEPTQEAGR